MRRCAAFGSRRQSNTCATDWGRPRWRPLRTLTRISRVPQNDGRAGHEATFCFIHLMRGRRSPLLIVTPPERCCSNIIHIRTTRIRLLAADVRKHPEVETSFREATGYQLPPRLQQRVSESWRNADLILCASTFTKKTLLEAGARDGACHVVPYGIELADMRNANRAVSGRFRALFVGSGVQRKGLHHLLCAWRVARLPADSELILVCRSLDAGLEPLLARTPRIRLIRSASREDLYRLYAESSLFVMPSLTEGLAKFIWRR